MYDQWHRLAAEYRFKDDGTPRYPNEIAKKIAADARAKDPVTEKAPAWTTVLRRLNEHYPDWKADGQKKVGQ